jgi:hypothetical protein
VPTLDLRALAVLAVKEPDRSSRADGTSNPARVGGRSAGLILCVLSAAGPLSADLAHRAALIPLLNTFFAWAKGSELKLSARSELAKALARLAAVSQERRTAAPGGRCRGKHEALFGVRDAAEAPGSLVLTASS